MILRLSKKIGRWDWLKTTSAEQGDYISGNMPVNETIFIY